MTPPTPSRPVRITNYNRADIVFPCWLNLRATGWCHFQGSTWATMAIEDATHFAPDSPECPTCVPDDLALEDEPPVDTTQRLTCRCGDPSQPGVVHCKILPCYLAEPTPTAPDLPADEAALLEVIRRHYPEELPAPIPVTAPLPASEGTPIPCLREAREQIVQYVKSRNPQISEEKTIDSILGRVVAAPIREIQAAHVRLTTDNDRLESELASLRTLLATAEKERDEATASMSEWMQIAQRRADSIARLTPSASQSAEMEKKCAELARDIVDCLRKGFPERRDAEALNALEMMFAAIALRHFTTPTQ
jgi:hypothetical protein